MRLVLACLLTGLVGIAPALAFDAATDDVLARMKIGKVVPITDVATLMAQSERWCYLENGAGCRWSDVYLAVTGEGATYEIGSPWDDALDIYFTDQGTFEEERFICEANLDWVPSVRAVNRKDGTALGGRALWAVKAQLLSQRGMVRTCFDYVLAGSDAAAETISLTQREWVDGVLDPNSEVPVTVHFNADTAAALTLQL